MFGQVAVAATKAPVWKADPTRPAESVLGLECRLAGWASFHERSRPIDRVARACPSVSAFCDVSR
jgi:hypothetical protein